MSTSEHSVIPKAVCQVAAVCYRKRSPVTEFLLVNTNKGKWTFPKGCMEPHISHSEAAALEAFQEAGAAGYVEKKPFHVYLSSKGVFWRKPGIREFGVKAFLLEVHWQRNPQEEFRNPTWFRPAEAKEVLSQGREIKYRDALIEVIDKALERIRAREYNFLRAQSSHKPVRRNASHGQSSL